MNTERWKLVVGFDNYEVSNFGRVRNIRTQKMLKPRTVRYPHVALAPGAVEKTIHTLVLEAFVGPCPTGMQALHWDDDKCNNLLGNLRWGTASENQADAQRNGVPRRGPILPKGHALRVLDLNTAGIGHVAISRYLNINRNLIPRILENPHRYR